MYIKEKNHTITEMIECDNDSSNILDNMIEARTLSASLGTLIILVEDTQISYYYPKA
jgi:hypothetical protein